MKASPGESAVGEIETSDIEGSALLAEIAVVSDDWQNTLLVPIRQATLRARSADAVVAGIVDVAASLLRSLLDGVAGPGVARVRTAIRERRERRAGEKPPRVSSANLTN